MKAIISNKIASGALKSARVVIVNAHLAIFQYTTCYFQCNTRYFQCISRYFQCTTCYFWCIIFESIDWFAKFKCLNTVDNTSMNLRLFKESIMLIFSGTFWARDNSNTNFCILISRAFRWNSQIFTPTHATADIRQNMNLSNLFDL